MIPIHAFTVRCAASMAAAAVILVAAFPARGAEDDSAGEPAGISPAAIRIRVALDEDTLATIRETIRREIAEARAKHARRLARSRRIVERAVSREAARPARPVLPSPSAAKPSAPSAAPAASRPAVAVPPAPPPEATLDEIRTYVRSQVEAALAARRKRLGLSPAQLSRVAGRELIRVNDHLLAIERARRACDAAKKAGDGDAARTWAALAEKRARTATELARRLTTIESALAASAIDAESLTDDRREAIADRALDAIEDALRADPPLRPAPR
jgi:hypothetical protein